jgi:hypothetical protein
VGIANTSLDQMRKFLVEFGMTPASRSRLSVADGDDKNEDAFETFMKGIGGADITYGNSDPTDHGQKNIRGKST